MFQSGWFSLIGLVIEIIGLGFLFKDLLTSKEAGVSTLEFEKLQDEIDLSTQELIVRLNNGLFTMAEFIAGYLSILELEAKFNSNPQAAKAEAERDEETAELIKFLEEKTTVGLRNFAVATFAEAQNKFMDKEKVKRALALVKLRRQQLSERYAEEVSRSEHLQRVVKFGVLFVSIGAAFQLFDLVW